MVTCIARPSHVALCVILCVVAAASVFDPCDAGPASSSAITVEYAFPRPEILPGRDGAHQVRTRAMPSWGAPGKPVLPYRTAQLLLPADCEVEDVAVDEAGWRRVPGRFVIEHGQRPVPISRPGDVRPIPRDAATYSAAGPFPSSPATPYSIQRWRGHAILILNFFPVRYLPAARTVEWCPRISVTVTVRSPAHVQLAPRVRTSAAPGDLARLSRQVDNPELLDTYAPPARALYPASALLDPGTPADYVIITNDQLASAAGDYTLQDLADLKESQGLTAAIVTSEWIYANYDGTRPDGQSDDQTRIRNFIADAYNTWGTQYVLLAGDADGADLGGESGDLIVPHRGFYADWEYFLWYADDNIPADMYYGCLDGTFDYDADGYYGEPNDGPAGGEVDLLPEVSIGRIPVDSAQEISDFVAKQYAYAEAPPSPHVWMVGEYLGFGGVADWWAGPGFVDTSIVWMVEPHRKVEVRDAEAQAVHERVQVGSGEAG